MQRMMWAAAVAALMLVVGSPMALHAETPQAKKQAKAKAPKSRLSGEYAKMAQELDLTSEQKDKLEAIAVEHKQANADWSKQNKDALVKAAADRKSSDPETRKAGAAEYSRLSKQRHETTRQYSDQALAVLTAEQRSKWEAAKLAQRTETVLKRSKITLTEEQANKLRSLAAQSLQGVDASDAKAYRNAYNQLNQQVSETVLTQEQRNLLPAPKAKPAAKAKAGSQAKPKAKPASKKKAPVNDDADDQGGDDDMM